MSDKLRIRPKVSQLFVGYTVAIMTWFVNCFLNFFLLIHTYIIDINVSIIKAVKFF